MQLIPLNNQPREKSSQGDGKMLAVNSIFYTIQGEGPFAGCPAVFIRLAGCNLQCPMCDTEYTSRKTMAIDTIVDKVVECAAPGWALAEAPLVVITGGEPFRQPLLPLVRELLRMGVAVQVETNGTLHRPELPFHHKDFHVVCSPKTGKIAQGLVPYIKALKYVATAESLMKDGLPQHALAHPNNGQVARPPKGWKGQVYLQPVDEKDEAKNAANLKAVVESCMLHGYRLCLQVHKIIEVE